jgi:hypothetical protein
MKPGDIFRVPDYEIVGGYRVWVVVAVNLGATGQENYYSIRCLDKRDADRSLSVPCILLDQNREVTMCVEHLL